MLVFDSHGPFPIIEEPGLYRRNGCYICPGCYRTNGLATGVTVEKYLRAIRKKSGYGPRVRRLPMERNNESGYIANQIGPLQLQFQDKKVDGRMVHLQPMKWLAYWQATGIDKTVNDPDSLKLKGFM